MHASAYVALLLLADTPPPVPLVTPVSGPSWIQHLGIELDDTHMGKMGGEGPPPPGERREPVKTPEPNAKGMSGMMRRFMSRPAPDEDESLNAPFMLAGEDLYRLDCRSCHGPDGRGAPPEIHSLLEPARATSAAMIEERQRREGRRLPPGMARQLAADASKALVDRIANGGKKMPPFPHLVGDEVTALVEYLKALAGVPAERHARMVTESVFRAGEHLVKGTCHVCHPATGPGPSHMMMYMRGVIPSLASMPQQMSPASVLGKVRAGAYGGMGMMARMSRMPVFGYLTDEEVMAAYLYLARYPPLAR